MDNKKFRAFVIAYIVNISVIIITVTVMILAVKDILPDFFRYIGLGALLIDVIWFRNFASQYKK
ncbi:MAG: hypothetical protein E7507_06660 [Ruminococcus sp.]|nr:hypothetical protein [Ruminococcus sp.]